MKTRFSLRLLMIVALVAVVTASCSKKDDFGTSGNNTGGFDVQIGQIVDHGPVADNLRQMSVQLVNLGDVYDFETGDLLGKVSAINFNVLTAEDGMISSGTYMIKAPGTLEPYTFGEGSMLIHSNDPGEGIKIFELTSGTLDIVQDGDHYDFYLNLSLDSGNMITFSTNGKMSYQDSY